MIVAAVNIDFVAVTVGLFGGLALFLYGMHEMSTALKLAAGEGLKTLLERLTSNRFTAALTGAVLTAIIQSSSVTTVLLVGFVNAGLMSLQQSVGVIMGANAGTTITGQIAAFKVTEAAWMMILVGYGLSAFVKRGSVRHYGTMLLGLGLLFLGMEQMSQATQPLRSYDPFIQMMQRMDHPVAGILVGAAFTALVQSSSATTGIVITLAAGGFLSLEAGIALTLGANIGTCFTAMLSTIGKSPVAVRTAVVHVIFNVAGAMIWVGFIGSLADFARQISPLAENLSGVERLAAETPRQIANANTIFNLANTLILIWFVTPIARLAVLIVPEKTVEKPAQVQPEFLDPVYLETPSLAFDRVRLEVGHLGRRVVEMIDHLPQLSTGNQQDVQWMKERGQEVEQLRSAMLSYLRSLDVAEFSDKETQRMEQCLSAIVHLGGAAELMTSHMVPLAVQRMEQQATMSEATMAELAPLYVGVREEMEEAIASFCELDEQQAAEVVASRVHLKRQAREAMSHLTRRMSSGDPNRELLFNIETELVSHLRWLAHTAGEIAELVG